MPAGPNEFSAGKSRIAPFGRFVARMPRRARFIYAFLILLSFFLSNGRVIGQIDSIPAALLPVALLVEGSLTYDGIIEGLGRGKAPEGFVKTTHGLVSFFPIMTGLMALPIYAPVIAIMRLLASPSPQDWVKLAWRFQKLPAAVFATLAVLAFWRLCEAIEFASSLSICLTLWLAFGSELFSVGAQSLWQHGPGMLAVIATVDAQVRLRNHPTTRQALVLSTFCGLAIAIRPTNVLIVGPFGLLGLVQQPRLWLPLFAPVAAALALLIAYNLHFFGVELGGYAWVPRTVAIGNLGQGLPGLLFSPGRGLLIYFVVTAVAAAALALRPRTLTDPTAAAAVFGAVATFLLFSCFPWWWGAGPTARDISRRSSHSSCCCLVSPGEEWIGRCNGPCSLPLSVCYPLEFLCRRSEFIPSRRSIGTASRSMSIRLFRGYGTWPTIQFLEACIFPPAGEFNRPSPSDTRLGKATFIPELAHIECVISRVL